MRDLSQRSSVIRSEPSSDAQIPGQVGQVGQVHPLLKKFRRASEIPLAATEWLWQDRILLGALNILEGVTGHGKSAISYDLAACVTNGVSVPFRNNRVDPAGVVILQCEAEEQTQVVPGLVAAGADRSRIYLTGSLVLPDDIGQLEYAIRDVSAKLVVIDPINDFFGPSITSQNVGEVLSLLDSLAKKHATAMLLVRHLTKARNAASEYLGAGSVRIIGKVRSALRVEDHPDEQLHHHVLVHIKGNLSAAMPQPFQTVRHENGTITVEWLPTDQEVHPPRPRTPVKSKLDEATDFLFEILADGPVKARDIIAKALSNDLKEKPVREAKQAAGIVHKKHFDGKVSTLWDLPDESASLFEEISVGLAEFMKCSRVIGSNHPPYVIRYNDRLTVVKRHLGGGPTLRISIRPSHHGGSSIFSVEDGKQAVEFDVSDPATFDQCREEMKRFNLEWDDDEFKSFFETE